MLPITYWIQNIRTDKKKFRSGILYRCEIFGDRLDIYKKDERIINLLIQDIQGVQQDLGVLIIMTTSHDFELLVLEPANPIFPMNKSTPNLTEAYSMKMAIEEILNNNQITIEPNPYIRNKFLAYFINDLEKLDLSVRPEVFYEKYVKKSQFIHMLKVILIGLIIGFLVWIIALLILLP